MWIKVSSWFYDGCLPGDSVHWVLSISLIHTNQIFQRGPVHWRLSAKPTARQIRKAIKIVKRMYG